MYASIHQCMMFNLTPAPDARPVSWALILAPTYQHSPALSASRSSRALRCSCCLHACCLHELLQQRPCPTWHMLFSTVLLGAMLDCDSLPVMPRLSTRACASGVGSTVRRSHPAGNTRDMEVSTASMCQVHNVPALHGPHAAAGTSSTLTHHALEDAVQPAGPATHIQLAAAAACAGQVVHALAAT